MSAKELNTSGSSSWCCSFAVVVVAPPVVAEAVAAAVLAAFPVGGGIVGTSAREGLVRGVYPSIAAAADNDDNDEDGRPAGRGVVVRRRGRSTTRERTAGAASP